MGVNIYEWFEISSLSQLSTLPLNESSEQNTMLFILTRK